MIMLEDLKIYDNLGTPRYFWELFYQLKKKGLWTEKEISLYFFNRIIDDRSIFDGCVPLLKLSKIIYVTEKSNEIEIMFPYRNIFHSEQLCQQKLLEGFLLALRRDENFYNILSSEWCSYDIIYKAVQIDYSAFGLRYANIRKLLIDFDFLRPHPDFPHKKLLVNPGWKKYFDNMFAPEIRKRKIGIEELRKNIEQQQMNGEEAEKFVLEFERSRLNKKDGIEWIAPYDSGAGFDILSFDKLESNKNDRFIEVKSFAGSPYFYWSKNEIEKAKKLSNQYFLYLVDRDKISEVNYTPIMIKNPNCNIFSDKNWGGDVQSWFFSYENNFLNIK